MKSSRQRTPKTWTEAEDNLLRREYGELTATQLANRLETTIPAIWARVKRLGLQGQGRSGRPSQWSPADVDFTTQNYLTMTPREIAHRLNKHPQTVMKKARELGFSRLDARIHSVSAQLKLSKEEWAYLAGLIDGEGHFTILRSTRKKGMVLVPVVGIANSSPEMVKWLSRKVPWDAIAWESPLEAWAIRKIPTRRPVARLWIRGSKVMPILKGLKPYLTAKRTVAGLLLEFCESRTTHWGKAYSEREIHIEREVKELNSHIPKSQR